LTSTHHNKKAAFGSFFIIVHPHSQPKEKYQSPTVPARNEFVRAGNATDAPKSDTIAAPQKTTNTAQQVAPLANKTLTLAAFCKKAKNRLFEKIPN